MSTESKMNRLSPPPAHVPPLLPSVFPQPAHDDDDDGDAVGDAETLPFMISARTDGGTQRSKSGFEHADSGPEEEEEEEPDPDVLLESAPAFSSFFTVIEDIGTGEHHHPHVRYVFSDDDPEHLTNGLLRVLDPRGTIASDGGENDAVASKSSSEARDERYLLVDIGADAQTVTSARSLSSDWQISDATTSVAPTFSEGTTIQEAGLMLKIEGQELDTSMSDVTPRQLLYQGEVDTTEQLLARMSTLAEQFQTELAALQKLDHERNPTRPSDQD